MYINLRRRKAKMATKEIRTTWPFASAKGCKRDLADSRKNLKERLNTDILNAGSYFKIFLYVVFKRQGAVNKRSSDFRSGSWKWTGRLFYNTKGERS